MEIDSLPINTGLEKTILIDENIVFNKEDLSGTDLLDLKDVFVNGSITKDSLEHLKINIIVKGTMVLPCARTLKPVDYNFEVKIEGDLVTLLEEIDKNFKNNQKTLDILPIIWENILMEIPMRVVSEEDADIITSGDGWELITEEVKVNPSLAKLRDLL